MVFGKTNTTFIRKQFRKSKTCVGLLHILGRIYPRWLLEQDSYNLHMRIPLSHRTFNIIRVYLICYILCIIDWHICQNIFGRIDIMYHRLSYVSGCDLPLKTLIFFIYRSRDIMQCIPQLYTIYSSYMISY
jgi:hypothetical protein